VIKQLRDRVLADVEHPTAAIQGFGNAGAQLAVLLATPGGGWSR
jgi:glutamate dehydrogenase/leucine dehydrogenase